MGSDASPPDLVSQRPLKPFCCPRKSTKATNAQRDMMALVQVSIIAMEKWRDQLLVSHMDKQGEALAKVTAMMAAAVASSAPTLAAPLRHRSHQAVSRQHRSRACALSPTSPYTESETPPVRLIVEYSPEGVLPTPPEMQILGYSCIECSEIEDNSNGFPLGLCPCGGGWAPLWRGCVGDKKLLTTRQSSTPCAGCGIKIWTHVLEQRKANWTGL